MSETDASMNTVEKHHCCSCVKDLRAALKARKRETQKLARTLKSTQRRVTRLKLQIQKRTQTSKINKSKPLPLTFFKK